MEVPAAPVHPSQMWVLAQAGRVALGVAAETEGQEEMGVIPEEEAEGVEVDTALRWEVVVALGATGVTVLSTFIGN